MINLDMVLILGLCLSLILNVGLGLDYGHELCLGFIFHLKWDIFVAADMNSR